MTYKIVSVKSSIPISLCLGLQLRL